MAVESGVTRGVPAILTASPHRTTSSALTAAQLGRADRKVRLYESVVLTPHSMGSEDLGGSRQQLPFATFLCQEITGVPLP